MNSTAWVALFGFLGTAATAGASVAIAYFKLRAGQNTIITHTNGLLNTEKQRTDTARNEVADLRGHPRPTPTADRDTV